MAHVTEISSSNVKSPSDAQVTEDPKDEDSDEDRGIWTFSFSDLERAGDSAREATVEATREAARETALKRGGKNLLKWPKNYSRLQ